MAFVHGKGAYVSLDATDLSAFCNSIEFSGEADSHDVTTFGKTHKVYAGGLKDGTCTLEGIYDDGATGPRATIQTLLGTVVEFIYRPEGTGVGKPESTVDVLVTSYEESAPVADMISWTCELQMSDAMVTADQSA